MSKLKNTEAIKRMLDGTHRTQTKTVVGWEDTKEHTIRKVGDRWSDKDGNEFEQRDGFIIKTKQGHEAFQELRDFLHIPSNCPVCKKEMNKRIDSKFYRMRKMCLDCVSGFETYLRINHKYETYEKHLITNNMLSELRHIKEQLEDYLKFDVSKAFSLIDGQTEEWTGGEDVKDKCKTALEDTNKMILDTEKQLKDVNFNIEDSINEWKEVYHLA